MEDKKLLHKIIDEVKNLCQINEMEKVNKLVLTVGFESKVNEERLYKKLKHWNKKMFGPWTSIQVDHDDIQQQTAILQTIEGDKKGK